MVKFYNSGLLAHLSGPKNGAQANSESKETFSIITAFRSVRNDEWTIQTRKAGIPSVLIANHNLLKWYCRSMSQHRISIGRSFEVKPKDGVANSYYPKDGKSAREYELGWGFDTHGCLSFYISQIEQDRVLQYVVYVERNIIKRQPGNEVAVNRVRTPNRVLTTRVATEFSQDTSYSFERDGTPLQIMMLSDLWRICSSANRHCGRGAWSSNMETIRYKTEWKH